MLEEYCVPYLMIINTAVLSWQLRKCCNNLRSSGRQRRFLYVRFMPVRRTAAAGNMLNRLCKKLLREKNIPVIGSYRIGKSHRVAPGKPPVFSVTQYLPSVTDNYCRYMTGEVIRDFKKRVVEVSTEPMADMPKDDVEEIPYQFPAGNTHNFGIERYRVAEALFDDEFHKVRKLFRFFSKVLQVKEHYYYRAEDIPTAIGRSLDFLDKDQRSVICRLPIFK
ncbi:Actin domain containing protein [Trichuris trichiura]|uniref:Actin domain containing protein n=1 Tax=Trichuris trichiura TaxID=36087 RepID=A0A077YW41_TRITR|nr:Actin domain containing protein [Trichuris trichiura]